MSTLDIPQANSRIPLPTTYDNTMDALNKSTMILPRWANANRLFDGDHSNSDSDNEHVSGNENGTNPDSWSTVSGENRENTDSETHAKATLLLYLLTLMASISSFVVGFDMVAASNIVVSLRKHFELTNSLEQLYQASAIGFAVIGAMVGGRANDMLGRKPTIVVGNACSIIGSLFGAAARNTFTLILGRLTFGFGIGLSTVTVPLFIAEHAPSRIRGFMVTLYYTLWSGGQLFATILYAAVRTKDESWRLMLGLTGLIAGLQLFGNILVPESPRWLVTQGRTDDAKQVLALIRGEEENVDKIIRDISNCISESTGLIANKPLTWLGVIKKVCKTRAVRIAVVVGAGLQVFQQLSGIAALMLLDVIIMKSVGVYDHGDATWMTILPASVKFLSTFIALYLVDKIGRKFLLIASLSGTCFSLFMIGLGLHRGWTHSPDVSGFESNSFNSCGMHSTCNACIRDDQCGFCHLSHEFETVHGSCFPVATYENVIDPYISDYGRCQNEKNAHVEWAYDYCPTNVAGLALIGLVFYMALFAVGLGPLPWTINAELYPLWARSFGNSVSTTCHWIVHLIVIMTVPILSDKMTRHGLIFLFVGFTFLGIIVVVYTLPETINTKLEEAERLFGTSWQASGISAANDLSRIEPSRPPPQYGVTDRVVHLEQISMDIPPYRDYSPKGSGQSNDAFNESEI